MPTDEHPDNERPRAQYVECHRCFAGPLNGDVRIIAARADGTTTETWHTDDCAQQDANEAPTS